MPSLIEQDPDLLLLKRKQAQLLRKKLDLVKASGLAFYRPHPKQDSFHRAGITYNRRFLRAGNRTGKSECGCSEDIAWLLNERTWYPEGDSARRGGLPQHPVKGLTITTDWDKVNEIWTGRQGEGGKVWKKMPSGFHKKSYRNSLGVIDTIECSNGSLWRFDTVKSFKSNPQGSESSDWDFVHIDEPCPENMWKAVSRGLMDRRGAAWFTCTLLTEFWINDKFLPAESGGEAKDGFPNSWVETASVYDNPYLTPEAIAEFEATLTDDEKQCRLYGIPLHLTGLVYKEFSRTNHVLTTPPAGWSADYEPPLDWPVYIAIDPHPRTPHAVLFCTVDKFGRRYYWKNIFHHTTIEDLSRQIREVTKDRHVIWTKVDPLAYINDPITDTNMAMEFERCGVLVEKATKDLSGGILKVKAGLRSGTDITNTEITFTPTVGRTLWEIQRYCWDEETDKPLDENDHMMENLYRLELSEPRWVDAKDSSRPIEDMDIVAPRFTLDDLEFSEK